MAEKKEWLTQTVADEYCKKAKSLPNPGHDVGERWELRRELQRKYNVTELEAINIINGHHIRDYVEKYQRLAKGVSVEVKPIEKIEDKAVEPNVFDDWLLQRVNEITEESDD